VLDIHKIISYLELIRGGNPNSKMDKTLDGPLTHCQIGELHRTDEENG